MKNVEIYNERGQFVARFKELSVEQRTLEATCEQYGAGKYSVKWDTSKNMGEGKPRKRYKETRTVYVYADDADGGAPAMAMQKAGGVYAPVIRAGVGVSDMRAFMEELDKRFEDKLAPLKTALAAKGGDQDDEDDEDFDEEESEIVEQIITLARKPEYARVTAALMSFAPEEQKWTEVDAALQENPNIMRELLFDFLELVMQRIGAQ